MDQPDQKTNVYLRIGKQGRTPLYATFGSAGCDLFAACAMTLLPGECRVVPLDLVMAIEPGVEAQIRPRSGLSLKTELRIPNAPGTIDSDYRSEVGVLVQNTFATASLPDQILLRPHLIAELAANYRRLPAAEYLKLKAAEPAMLQRLADNWPELADDQIWIDKQGNPYGTIYIQPGDRIAQMIFSRCLQANFIEHPEPEQIGLDRGGGFGSTGVRPAD